MPNPYLDIRQWAEERVTSMTTQIKSLIDGGMDMESAVDYAFDNSILANPYKMRVLENVGNYRHEHRFVLDVITGREWCATCQQFKEIK